MKRLSLVGLPGALLLARIGLSACRVAGNGGVTRGTASAGGAQLLHRLEAADVPARGLSVAARGGAMRRPVLLLVLLAAVVVGGCGGSKRTAAQAPAPPTSPAPTTTAPVTTTTRQVTTTAPAPPARAAFQPVSFTAVSESDFWVLGTAACASGRCTAILGTSDGGGTFEPVRAPALAAAGGVEPTLRFADRSDGWAFVAGPSGAFFSTHDGGATWRPLALGDVLAFASGGGYAYAVTASCTLQRCTGYRFERTPVSSDTWSGATLPFAPDGSVLDLAAHGTNLWLLGTSAGPPESQHDELARSTDGGRTFVTGPGPCIPGLGGDLSPTSADVVWAVCPTGMLAGAWRSTDGGVTFSAVKTPALVNSAALAPASDATAVLARNGARSPLLRTTDGGGTWTPAHVPRTPEYSLWLGFTDAAVGAAIVQAGNGRTPIQELWRTTDGGADWSRLRLG